MSVRQHPVSLVMSQPNFLQHFLSLGISYFRWTQLTPLFVVRGGAILMLAVVVFAGFEEQSISAMESFLVWLLHLPVVGEALLPYLSSEYAAEHPPSVSFKTFLLRIWGIASLVFMLTGLLISAVFGPFTPWTLKRKMALLGICTAVLMAGMIATYFASSGNFNGSTFRWMLQFFLIALLVFLVSSYSLVVSHGLQRLNDHLMASQSRTVPQNHLK